MSSSETKETHWVMLEDRWYDEQPVLGVYTDKEEAVRLAHQIAADRDVGVLLRGCELNADPVERLDLYDQPEIRILPPPSKGTAQ